ncbi:tumor suppressor p53-binding protein 1 [Plakobranchus ocellatus]|uniref:Tumor suppressor p53-binding protein 1 n=1 Tax=Plakobranchus ocellatus TaxID=259542 RepID=A0AAV4AZ54_9GAST|nr:tumor suppressor p53-binding protein 1 [Plakobranchus ocellatus]
MEPSQEWSICTEINSEGIDFVVPDSLSHESFLTAHSSRNLPGLQSHPESVSPVLFDCNEENPIKIMASDKHGKNPFAVESEMETDPADALVADTASDHSGNSLREESDTNVTVVQRLPAEATPRQTSTPAQMLTCLQLSGNPINVPETMDSLDAVSPTLDVFDPHPTVVPDSPSEDHDNLQDIHQSEEPKENDDDDEDDDVVSFKPLASTMKKDEEMVTQAETQQSVGLLGSQNFHLRFSPSQATSVYGEKDDVTDDYGLMHDAAAAAVVPDEQSQEPDVVLESQGQATLAESVDRSKPSFCLQKPADTFEDTALPGEGSEGSISVFKRIKAGVSSPLKLKKVADDSSEEMEISRTASRRHLQIFDVGELSASKSEHSTLPTTSKSVFLKEVKESFSAKDNKGTTKTSLSDVKKQEKAGDKNLQKRSQKEQHQTMVISQEIDSPCDDQNDTISYSYSEDRNPTDVAATGDKSMDLGDPFLNPSDLVKNQLSDSGSDNFMLSQKRMVPAAKTNIAESFKGFEPPLDKDESVLGIHSLKDKSLQVASDFPLPKQTDTSKQKSSKKDPNTALQRDVLDFEVMEEREKNNNTTGASKEVASSITKSQLFSEGSTLAQSTSLDPYTFRDSQSQSFAAGPTMPLSDKPYISARGKKAAVVKTMRKVLRKKHPSQQADGKSSSSDASVSKPSKLRQGRRKKETLQAKSESFDAAGDAQAAESAGSKGPLEGFTVLQDHEKFSRPVDPPPTKHSIKHVSGSKGSLEVLPSSQSLPTPAQRQRSTEKPDVAVSLSHSDTMPGLKAAAPAVLPGVTESGPPAPSKSDSKRSSAGSNTGQDLFSTPNQSIINPADSQLGKILSSSASSTPDNPPAKIGLTSPPHGLTAPGTSRATTLGDVASSAAALFLGSASSSSYPVAVKNPSPASPLPSSRSFPKSQPRTVSATRSSDPHKISSGKSFQKEDHQTKETPDISAFDGRALRTSNSAEPKTCAELAASANSFTPRMRDKRKRNPSNQASGHVSKDDVSQSTDIQSTGFSVHGVPPSTASNDSRKGLASDATLAKTDAGDRAELGLQSGIRRDQPWPCVLSDYKSKPTIGAKVMGRWKDGFYYPGSLSKIEPGKRCKRSSLILSEDQAACLLSDEELRFTADAVTPSTSKPADISLDNLVEGKRHPRVAHQADASTSKDAAQASPAKTNRTDTASDTLTKSGRKRKMGPVATSTPTPKQARQGGKGTPVKGNKGNVLGSIISSPMESRKSPRKAKMDLFPSHIAANPSLFDGIVFMLTNAEKSAKWRAYERQLLQYSSLDTSVEESTDIEPDIPPYDKEKLQVLIEQHGGKIVSSLDAKTIASAHQCYLVAAEHQRTVKYMQALAAGVHVISHQWVLVSVQENQLQGLVAYTLPAGISYDERKLVEGSKGCPELSRQVIMVVSGSDDYVKAWTSILSLTQCKLTTKFPARATKNDPGVDVVVSDSTCPSSVVRRCGQLNVPLVSSEWVAQCLINGRLVDFKGDSKYAHDFMEGESIP